MMWKSKLMRLLLLLLLMLASVIRADEGVAYEYDCSCECCCFGDCRKLSDNETVNECTQCLKCHPDNTSSIMIFSTGNSTSLPGLTTTVTTTTIINYNYSTTRHSSDQSTSSSTCLAACRDSHSETRCNDDFNMGLIVALSVLGGSLLAGAVILTVACVHRHGCHCRRCRCRCRRCWRRRSDRPMLPSISFVDIRLSDCTPSVTQTSDEKCCAGHNHSVSNNNDVIGSTNGRQRLPTCRNALDEVTDVDQQKKKVSRGSVESEVGSLSGAKLHVKNGKYVYEVKKVFEQKSDAPCSLPADNNGTKTSFSGTTTMGGNSNKNAAAETGRHSNNITGKVAMLPPSINSPSKSPAIPPVTLSKPPAMPLVEPSTTSKPSSSSVARKTPSAAGKAKPSKPNGGTSDSSSGSSSSLEYSYAELPEEVLARQEAFMKSMMKASKSPKTPKSLKPGPTATVPRASPQKEPKLYVNM